MNLYLFNDNDRAATFGIGTYLRELSHALKGADIHIHIVHLRSIRPEFEIVKTNEIENWYIPEVFNQSTFDGSIQKVEIYYRNVIYLLRLNIYDTTNLVFHFNYNLCYVLAKGLKEVFDCKTVSAIHFIKWQLELNGNLSKLHAIKMKHENRMNSFEKLLFTTDEYEGLLFKEVDRVIALSQYIKDLLCKEYQLNPDKISVIPNGLTEIYPETKRDKVFLRKKWQISTNELLVLFVGRLHIAKGLTFLIEAFRKVLDKIPNCRLIIAGSGHYDLYIQEAKDICTKVTFSGLLNKDELNELYQIVDIGVLPSLTEQCSYVAIEMMMHAVPLIASACSGLIEMVEDDITGLHIPVTELPDKMNIDTSLLAEEMIYLLQHSEERKRIGVNACKHYKKFYSSSIMRENMLNFYTSLFETDVQSLECGGM